MVKIAEISIFGVLTLVAIYSLFLSAAVSKLSTGSKKLTDFGKIFADKIRSSQKEKIKNFSLVAMVIFVGLLYAFGWQSAVSFLVGALIFAFVNYFVANLSAKTAVRLAEVAKTDVVSAYKIGYKFSAAGTFLSNTSGVILLAATYLIFKDPVVLFSLALSAVLVSLFSTKNSGQNYLGGFVTALTVVLVLAVKNLSNLQNADIFTLAFAALAILVTAISGLIFHYNAKTPNLSSVFSRFLVPISVLFLAAAYFGSRYFLVGGANFRSEKLAIVLAVGLILALILFLARQSAKYLPILAIGTALIFSSFFSADFGLALVITGFLSLWPLVAITADFYNSIKNSKTIAESAEFTPAVENLSALTFDPFATSDYFQTISGIATAGLLTFYLLHFGDNFSASDSKLLAGLLFGAALIYVINLDFFQNKILRVSVIVLGAILAGLTLGPLFLAGVIGGAIITSLLLVDSLGDEVLVLALTGILSLTFVENQFSLPVRVIIGGAALLVVFGYYLFGKFYGRKK